MSSNTNPFASMIEVERRTAEQGREAMQRGIDLRSAAGRAWLAAMSAERAWQHSQLELVGRSADFWSSGALAAFPSDDGTREGERASVRHRFDETDRMMQESWDSFERTYEEGLKNSTELLERYADLVAESTKTLIDSQERYGRALGTGVGETNRT